MTGHGSESFAEKLAVEKYGLNTTLVKNALELVEDDR